MNKKDQLNKEIHILKKNNAPVLGRHKSKSILSELSQ